MECLKTADIDELAFEVCQKTFESTVERCSVERC